MPALAASSVRLDRSGFECRIGNMRPAISRSVMARLAGGTSADNAVMPIAVVDAERSRPIGSVLDQLRSSGRSSRSMESRVTEGTAALVRERVKVATSWFQMTRVYQTRDHVKNSLAGLWIVSPSLEERVQIEQLAAHLDEFLQYAKRQLIHS